MIPFLIGLAILSRVGSGSSVCSQVRCVSGETSKIGSGTLL